MGKDQQYMDVLQRLDSIPEALLLQPREGTPDSRVFVLSEYPEVVYTRGSTGSETYSSVEARGDPYVSRFVTRDGTNGQVTASRDLTPEMVRVIESVIRAKTEPIGV